MSDATVDKNGTFFDTATNVPIDATVKTRRNQAAVNTREPLRMTLGTERTVHLARFRCVRRYAQRLLAHVDR